MNQRAAILIALMFAVSSFCASCSSAPPWTNGEYLYRYTFWGVRHQMSPSEDYKLFDAHTIASSPTPYYFPAATERLPSAVEFQEDGRVKRVKLDTLLQSSGTHAFIIIRDGRLLYESYYNGYERDSLNISRSMAKSFTSALVGIAISEGAIKSVDDPIVDYLPELKGRGFDPITIRHLLMMQSGIKYQISEFPWGDDPLAFFYPNLSQLLLTDTRIAEAPGQAFHYADYNTLLLGVILKRTTHRSPSAYLEEKVWMPLGMEYPATWSIDSSSDGLELMHVALNARAIDFAKFGCLYLNDGNWNGRQIIPPQWVRDSTTRSPKEVPWETYSQFLPIGGYYEYQWWGLTTGPGPNDYSYMAFGRYGQFIFVSPRARMVIVRTGSEFGSIEPQSWPLVLQNVVDQMSASDPAREVRATDAARRD